MSGGTWEYVMGVMTNQSGNPFSGQNASLNSGFTGEYGEGGSLVSGYSWPDSRYYDTYSYHTSYMEYTRGHLGDATKETGPFQNIVYGNNYARSNNSWYLGHSNFIFTTYPWFMRGGHHENGSEANILGFYHNTGNMDRGISFRLILSPTI